MVAALLRVARVTAGLAESNGSYCRVYDSRHLQADCQEPGSAPEPYARQSSMGYLYLLYHITQTECNYIGLLTAVWHATGLPTALYAATPLFEVAPTTLAFPVAALSSYNFEFDIDIV